MTSVADLTSIPAKEHRPGRRESPSEVKQIVNESIGPTKHLKLPAKESTPSFSPAKVWFRDLFSFFIFIIFWEDRIGY